MTAFQKSIGRSVLIIVMMALGNSAFSQSTEISLNSTTIDETISLCRECADKAMLDERIKENLKVQVENVRGIVLIKDLEINALRNAKDILVRQYYQSEKEKKRAVTKAWWKGFKVGTASGAAVFLGAILLSK